MIQELTPMQAAIFALVVFVFIAIVVVLIETLLQIKEESLFKEYDDFDSEYNKEMARLKKEQQEAMEKLIYLKNIGKGKRKRDLSNFNGLLKNGK